ncbi:MAG: SIMPL domain-containing protein [Kiritimatiellae bacterium]|jgi:uncharacterized protein YggE|nr:SIMPL domain-containing protein [Kiritimatiellia bacterium]
MKQLTITAIVLASVLSLSTYAADSEQTVSVMGKAEETVKPDAAYVTVYAQADGILMVDAVKKVGKLVDEITSAVSAQSNIVTDIKVTDVALGEKQTRYYSSDQDQKSPSPQITRRLRIRCKPDAEGIYEVIDKAIRAGALMQTPSSIRYSDDIRSVVIYGLEQSAEVVDRVRKSAMANAKAEAKKSASYAEKSVGKVVKIGCSGSSNFNFPMRFMGQQADFPTEYIGSNSEEITISHAVSVTFELKD